MDVQLHSPLAYENAVNYGLPPDKQLIFGQVFKYFTDCTLGQVPFLADGKNYCHDKHFLKGKLADDAEREHWRNLRINLFSRLIIDAINRRSVGARVLIIGVMPHIIFPSIIKEAWLMAIDHFKEQGIDVKFDLQLIISPHFCSVVHGLNQEQLAKMDISVMQSTAWRGLLPAAMESCLQSRGGGNEEPDHIPHDHECGG